MEVVHLARFLLVALKFYRVEIRCKVLKFVVVEMLRLSQEPALQVVGMVLYEQKSDFAH